MNNVRRFLGSGAVTTPPADNATLPPPAESAPWVEKGTGWAPQVPRANSSVSSFESMTRGEMGVRRDSSSSGTVELPTREPTAPLFASATSPSSSSSRNYPTSGQSRFAQSYSTTHSSTSRHDAPVSPASTSSFDSPATILRSRSAGQARSSSSARKPPVTPSKAFSTPAQSPRAAYPSRNDSYHAQDELLMSLLSSQAVLDSREYEVLSSEEVDELKNERSYLTKRIPALNTKLNAVTRIRDGAARIASISSLKSDKGKRDPAAEASSKIDVAQRELLAATDRMAAVDRRLFEHRAAVLAHSIMRLEERLRASEGAESSDGTAGTTLSGDLSPVSTSTAPTTVSAASRSRFEGPHLFAGHSDAVVPALPRPLPTWKELDTLQERLSSATEASEAAKKQAVSALDQLSTLKESNADLERQLDSEERKAGQVVAQLERETAERQGLQGELQSVRAAKDALEREHTSLATALRQRSAALSALISGGPVAPLDGADDWDSGFMAVRDELMQLRQANAASSSRSSEELESGRSTLSEVARTLGIVLPGSVSSVSALAAALAAHVGGLQARLDDHTRTQTGWDAERARLENEIKRAMDAQERLAADVEDARRDRDEARTQLRDTQNATPTVILPPPRSFSGDAGGELEHVMTTLAGLFAQLPSTEARAKLTARSNMKSPLKSPKSPSLGLSASISELDVRSLKSLYDTSIPVHPGASPKEPFSFESFVERVTALLVDDRAIVERLIRMASGHELLKANAERARKLALDSSQGLETYQKQVKTLEERNAALVLKTTTLDDEYNQLQEASENLLQQKQQLEVDATLQAQAFEDSERARQDLEKNKKELMAQVAALQRSAKSGGGGGPPPSAELIAAKNEVEAQLAKARQDLEDAKEELARISMAESSQRIQLLDELNTLQQENGDLRNQIRNLKK